MTISIAPPPSAHVCTHYAAQGRLYRAIVSLPERLCPRDELLHERIVFFDGPTVDAGPHLEKLLGAAWNVDTAGWCGAGWIYNLRSASDLIEENESADIDARLFELSWGGPEGVGYAETARVDLFVAPVPKARLQAALARLVATGSTS